VICHLCHLIARLDKKIIIPATMEKVWWVVIHLTMLTLRDPLSAIRDPRSMIQETRTAAQG
jgi:hypothetical protein